MVRRRRERSRASSAAIFAPITACSFAIVSNRSASTKRQNTSVSHTALAERAIRSSIPNSPKTPPARTFATWRSTSAAIRLVSRTSPSITLYAASASSPSTKIASCGSNRATLRTETR